MQASVFCAFVAALCSAAAGRPAKDVAVAPFSLSLSGTIVPQSVSSPFIDHYEDPSQGSCRSDEKAVELTGVPGAFCAPSCSSSAPCPTDVPDGASARPMCCISTQGSAPPSLCALICSPAGASSQCPDGAGCQAIQTSGVCTYLDTGLPVLL